ncbi:ABC-F family ATP-binding cassette domain-containing protein [Ketogulonicigenium vulgare]|uniref:ABC-F family ATP-binding cassette domain-containing protein n=1 Tax=Ketogulonicigenium vulgare TaxID=92945 RepID=UPI0023583665|nr:ABC-F family ATP-binding cassette domain-containing protein [Ketogulonicigenium vulgare]
MFASITLSHLFFAKPDGQALFDNLNLQFGAHRTGLVGRNGTGKTTLLRLIAGEIAPKSGQIHGPRTIGYLRQEVAENPNQTIADLFGARDMLARLDRAAAGLATLEDLTEIDWTQEDRLADALAKAGLGCAPMTPLAALSGGQRTRAALAAQIFAAPDMLLLDEPTNNLDTDGRAAVVQMLRQWSGGAIVVSHDRLLLEEMDAIVELSSLGATTFGGNYSAYRAMKDHALAAAARGLSHAEKAQDEAAQRAQQAAERKARKDSAGRAARAKGDAPKIMLDAAKGRSEASGGAGARLREARAAAADEALTAARSAIEVLQPIAMDIPRTGLAAGKVVLRLADVTGGYGAAPIIRGFSLTLTGPQRIAITGPNGSGKTTLLKLITGAIAPQSGQIARMVPFAYLDQHAYALQPDQTLAENFARLNPAVDAEGRHSALARFGFRGSASQRLARDLSGGERLRAALACTMGGRPVPQLLILDEPTNHLDLDGIAALEQALADYDGAIIATSHDPSFLAALRADDQIAINSLPQERPA